MNGPVFLRLRGGTTRKSHRAAVARAGYSYSWLQPITYSSPLAHSEQRLHRAVQYMRVDWVDGRCESTGGPTPPQNWARASQRCAHRWEESME